MKIKKFVRGVVNLDLSSMMRANISTRDQFSFVCVEDCCVNEVNIPRVEYDHLDTCDTFIFSKRLRVWFAFLIGAAAVSPVLLCPGITVLHLDGIHQITRTLQSDGSDGLVLPCWLVIEWCSVQPTVKFTVAYCKIWICQLYTKKWCVDWISNENILYISDQVVCWSHCLGFRFKYIE